MDKRQAALVVKAESKLNAQKEHVARLIEQNPTQPSIAAAKRLVYVFEMEVSHLFAGKNANDFDWVAAGAEARKLVR